MITGEEQFLREMNESYLPFVCHHLNIIEFWHEDSDYTFHYLDEKIFYQIFGFYQYSYKYSDWNERTEDLIQTTYKRFIEQHGWKHSLPQATALYFKFLYNNVKKTNWKKLRDIIDDDDYKAKYYRITKRRWKRFLYRQYRYFKKITRRLEKEGQFKLRK
ncbi:MAG: hypothetical protein OXE55_04010 [Flavobacteriaceae bacterium]|nr:hypothetical protein [Flavobacteriaceae bacterium]MCY4253481.1 hypothetical protein [Flavobacteriaceae bacterium]